MLLPAAAFAQAPRGIPDDDAISFTVWRKGSQIGTHQVRFERQGDRLSVRTAADFAVGFGPITFYRYHYRVTEVWQGSELMTISAQTDDNGTEAFVEARRQGDAIAVDGSKSGRYIAPKGAIAGTHWNPAETGQPMINPENGELMHFTCREAGSETWAGGLRVDHKTLTGYATLDLWYDSQGVWRALKAVAKDGSLIEYRGAET
jgi:hypothetical protein